jgi:hypothetical protein
MVADACPLKYSALLAVEPGGLFYVVLAEDGIERSGIKLADDAKARLQCACGLLSQSLLTKLASVVELGKRLAAGQTKYREIFVTWYVTEFPAIGTCEAVIFVAEDVDADEIGKAGVVRGVWLDQLIILHWGAENFYLAPQEE